MKAVDAYTKYLEMALVTHDKPHIELYAQALAPLVMTGNVPIEKNQLYYEGDHLQKIKKKSYGMGKKLATKEQAAKLYRALDDLAFTKAKFKIDVLSPPLQFAAINQLLMPII